MIVLGVLAAFAVDEWREAAEQQEIHEQLIAGLIADLEENAIDYEEVLRTSENRLEHCRLILSHHANADASQLPESELFGDALYELGYFALLETADGAYAEMAASGTGVVIRDTELRLRIAKHYSLARDQADLNDFREATTRPYHDALLRLGFSPADRNEIDYQMVLNDPEIRAILRSMEETLGYVIAATGWLIDSNQELQHELLSAGDTEKR